MGMFLTGMVPAPAGPLQAAGRKHPAVGQALIPAKMDQQETLHK